ncbi:hypothetical protein DNK55_25320 [Streptomyces sp. AC1-42T]|nr:hypothetical protein DNK55_25320 [Streptomyces sp. AC1-42T]
MDALLAAYDERVRGHDPERAPMGSVVERDGPAVRIHYGTHGTVRHAPLGKETDRTEITRLIRRQQEAFAARCEPAEWRSYGHDPIPMKEPLRAAGFTAVGPPRTLLIAELGDLTGTAPARGLRVRRLGHGYRRMRELDRLVAACEPHPRGLADIREDHGSLLNRALNVQLLEAETRLAGAGWAEAVGATEFVAVRGMTGPHTEFLPHWVRWARNNHALHLGAGKAPERLYLTAEAPEGPILDALLTAGFRALSSVRDYLWPPAGPPPAAQRPDSMLLDDPDHHALRKAFEADFSFKPSHTYYPAIEEPPDSVTWHVGDVTDTRHPYGLMRDLPSTTGWRASRTSSNADYAPAPGPASSSTRSAGGIRATDSTRPAPGSRPGPARRAGKASTTSCSRVTCAWARSGIPGRSPCASSAPSSSPRSRTSSRPPSVW